MDLTPPTSDQMKLEYYEGVLWVRTFLETFCLVQKKIYKIVFTDILMRICYILCL